MTLNGAKECTLDLFLDEIFHQGQSTRTKDNPRRPLRSGDTIAKENFWNNQFSAVYSGKKKNVSSYRHCALRSGRRDKSKRKQASLHMNSSDAFVASKRGCVTVERVSFGEVRAWSAGVRILLTFKT